MSYRIKVTSGPYAGRYVGIKVSGIGLVTNPAVHDVVDIPGADFSLHPIPRDANEYTVFSDAVTQATQSRLKSLGYESERDEVDILDFLVGLKLSYPKIEDKIVEKCSRKFKENVRTDCVYLFFEENEDGDKSVVIKVEKDATAESLKGEIERMRGLGYDRILRVAY
jgi:hypothetical protein